VIAEGKYHFGMGPQLAVSLEATRGLAQTPTYISNTYTFTLNKKQTGKTGSGGGVGGGDSNSNSNSN
jgi:hypothetical protein